MSTDYNFTGWVAHDKTAAEGNMKWEEFKPKTWEETDVDIEITHCGICASDLHTLRSGWYPSHYPLVVGHELIGAATKVGSQVKHIKVGDRVGVGAQSGSCQNQNGDCEGCADGANQHCKRVVNTYDGKWRVDGSYSKGGYATYWRGQGTWVVKIPDELPSDVAAPMLCGGITAFSPLRQHDVGPGKRVGIIGMGGLGHFGVMGAAALGADKIVAISRHSTKKEDALKMGATHYIATDEDEGWHKGEHAGSLDVIVSTISSPKMPLQKYLSLLRFKGRFVQVGAPEDNMPSFNIFALLAKRASIWGSSTGSPTDIAEMLEFFAKKGVKTWNQNWPMSEANKAIVDQDAGNARYRYVLVNEKAGSAGGHGGVQSSL